MNFVPTQENRANAHALFLTCQLAFHRSIILPDTNKQKLRAAQRVIRSHLRKALPEALSAANFEELYPEQQFRMALGRLNYTAKHRPDVSVKFLTQGSAAYDLQLDGAWPNQGYDLDDGLYLRHGFFGDSVPGISASMVFRLVEMCLEPLCRTRKWILVGEGHPDRKNSCVRVIIEPSTGAHIDLPIYIVPDQQFDLIQEAKAYGRSALAMNDVVRQSRLWIDEERVMLVHRTEGLIRSDPRTFHKLFEDAVDRYGPALRRQCRYAKALRDFQWPNGGPSSVCLMVGVVQAFDAFDSRPDETRDDLVFLEAICHLEGVFASEIENVAVPGAPALNHDWSEETTREYVQKLAATREIVSAALNDTAKPSWVVEKLRNVLGVRFPDREDLVECRAPRPAAAALPAAPAIFSQHDEKRSLTG